jgi:hypothetical protein
MIQGQPKFTGLALGRLTVNRMAPTMEIEAKVAFVDVATGVTYGWTEAKGALWSKDTLEKLAELISSMEQDVAAIHLNGGTAEPIIQTAKPTTTGGGLGEHLGDASSI